nr:hypothetical protein BgiMline_028583 [Biomphalaria glabrata]
MLHILLIFLFMSCNDVCTCDDTTLRSVTYYDRDVEPVGCNETSSVTTTSGSKLSCAVSCMLSYTCAVFRFSETTCLMCSSDVIQNLTFNTGLMYSWPYQKLNTFISGWCIPMSTCRIIPLQKDISIGSVVHLSCYPVIIWSPYYFMDLQLENKTTALTLRVEVYQDHLFIRTSYIYNNTINYNMTNVNSTHSLDILVANDGYQIFVDQTFIKFAAYRFPYNSTKFLRIRGCVDIYDLSVW